MEGLNLKMYMAVGGDHIQGSDLLVHMNLYSGGSASQIIVNKYKWQYEKNIYHVVIKASIW